jgi:hypothetical protein
MVDLAIKVSFLNDVVDVVKLASLGTIHRKPARKEIKIPVHQKPSVYFAKVLQDLAAPLP